MLRPRVFQIGVAALLSPCDLPRWTLNPHSDGPSPRVGGGCPSVVFSLGVSELASSADIPRPVHGLPRHQNHHGRLAQNFPPMLTPGHGPTRPLSGESACVSGQQYLHASFDTKHGVRGVKCNNNPEANLYMAIFISNIALAVNLSHDQLKKLKVFRLNNKRECPIFLFPLPPKNKQLREGVDNNVPTFSLLLWDDISFQGLL